MKVNVGCGEYPLWGYVNLDADAQVHPDLCCTVPPLPFGDGDLEEVYAGHFMEHLSLDDARAFLAECYRCLEPGGRLCIVVPDTREVLRRYLTGSIDAVEYPQGVWWSMADLDAVCAMFLYSTVQDSLHQWAYDVDTLGRALVREGFRQLREVDRYRDPRIAQGAWYQVGIEGVKP